MEGRCYYKFLQFNTLTPGVNVGGEMTIMAAETKEGSPEVTIMTITQETLVLVLVVVGEIITITFIAVHLHLDLPEILIIMTETRTIEVMHVSIL